MGRSPCCAKEGLNRGAWTSAEDKILTDYINIHGEGRWRHLPKRAGLKRCGKSCRLRWLNYLRPEIKRGNITQDEEDLIIRLHNLLGNRWALIAGRLPGRTDNEIKNYWNTNIGKKLQNGNKETDLIKPPPKTTPSGPCLIQTKATRCTKVILSQELQPSMKVAQYSSTHNDDENSNNLMIKMEVPALVDSEGITNNVLDFMVDNFEVDENVFSDLMNMDISLEAPSCFDENKVVAEEAADTSTTNNNNVSDDSMLHSSEDFQSSILALMDINEFDWL